MQEDLLVLDSEIGRYIRNGQGYLLKTIYPAAGVTGEMRMTLQGCAVISQLEVLGSVFEKDSVNEPGFYEGLERTVDGNPVDGDG